MPVRLSHEQASTALLAGGYEPLEPYPGTAKRWRCRCIHCGTEGAVFLRCIRPGSRCPHCTKQRGTCKIDGCSGLIRGQGYCSSHYDRLRRHGDPLVEVRVARYDAGAVCKVDGCTARPASRGWCSAHWQRWKHHGDPLGGNPPPRVRRAVDHEDGTRSCLDCGERKPLEELPKDRNATGGHRSNCKPCHTQRAKDWYARNRERQAVRQRTRYQRDIEKNRERDRVRYERDKAKRVDLATEQVHRRRALMAQVPRERGVTVAALRKRDGDNCYYCWTELSFVPRSGHQYQPDRATLEHMVPLSKGGGHTFANCVLACWQCNVRKNARSEREWLVALASTAAAGSSPEANAVPVATPSTEPSGNGSAEPNAHPPHGASTAA